MNMMQKGDIPPETISKHVFPLALLLLASAVAIWSVINVQDTYLTWVLEAAPAIVWMAALILTYKRFRFPNWMYAVMCVVVFKRQE